jgi:hypothetical protein
VPARRLFVVAVTLWLPVLAAGAARGAGPVIGWGRGAPPPTIRASAIDVGSDYGCAIESGTGKASCWGRNDAGQAMPPPSVNGTSGTASAISAGSYHPAAAQSSLGAPSGRLATPGGQVEQPGGNVLSASSVAG